MTGTSRIRTDRLELVPLTTDDAAEMAGVLADPALYAFIGGWPPTADELEARYRDWLMGSPRAGERWLNWVIRLRDGGPAVGHLQATVTGSGRAAEIAWIVGARWQGHGYATEAARALVGLLEASGATTITAFVQPENAASARVARRAGLAPTEEVVAGEVAWRRETPDAGRRPG